MNSQIPEKCDVLIVGGGPTGSMAAAILSKKGIDVVLLEKQQFPRDTVGESLIPHVWNFLGFDRCFPGNRGGRIHQKSRRCGLLG